jgi:hypothetical protein
MTWVAQTILLSLGITLGCILIIMLIYKLTSRSKKEE